VTALPPDHSFRSITSAVLTQTLLHAELIKVEWEAEKSRLLSMVIMLLAGTVCLFMGLLSLSAVVLVCSWGTPFQNPVLYVMTGAYCLGAVIAGYRLRALVALGAQAFADSRCEIAADLALIRHKLGE
jgi:uncharacterized membrane protein YqjE